MLSRVQIEGLKMDINKSKFLVFILPGVIALSAITYLATAAPLNTSHLILAISFIAFSALWSFARWLLTIHIPSRISPPKQKIEFTTTAELEQNGYREDKKLKKACINRFWQIGIPAVLFGFSPVILVITHKMDKYKFYFLAAFVLGIIGALITIYLQNTIPPKCPYTGEELTIFQEDEGEITYNVYVSPEIKKYCKIIYADTSGGSAG